MNERKIHAEYMKAWPKLVDSAVEEVDWKGDPTVEAIGKDFL